MRQKQQAEQGKQPLLLQPYKGQPGKAAGGVVSGANRAAWMRYAEEAAANGDAVTPYAQWVKQQQGK
jgi:hypothetical protein